MSLERAGDSDAYDQPGIEASARPREPMDIPRHPELPQATCPDCHLLWAAMRLEGCRIEVCPNCNSKRIIAAPAEPMERFTKAAMEWCKFYDDGGTPSDEPTYHLLEAFRALTPEPGEETK